MASPSQVMLLTSISQISRKHTRKLKSNRNRRLRRKRNKKYFLLKLKAKRAKHSEDILCDSITNLFEVENEATMNLNKVHNTTVGLPTSMQEISEWQNQHQLVYWKSKALALQMENQMLHKHIKHLYDNQMNQYLCYKDQAWKEVDSKENTQKRNKLSTKHDSEGNTPVVESDSNKEVPAEEDSEMSLPPAEQPGEARRKKLVEMYGDKAAKINGMETALQLNFEYHMSKYKPNLWPNIPLKM